MRDGLARRGVAGVEIEPGAAGQFDVFVDGRLAYSKRHTGRFPTDAEIDALADG